MKKIISILLISALALTGCTDRTANNDNETSESIVINSSEIELASSKEKKENSSEDSSESSEENSEAEEGYSPMRIKYPQFLTEKLKNHYIFKEADQNKNAVIMYNMEVLTDEAPVRDFLNKAQNGAAAKLYLYTFMDNDMANFVSINVIEYDGNNYYQYFRNAKYPEDKNIFDLDSNSISWEDTEKISVKSVKVESEGTLKVEYNGEFTETYTFYQNIRDFIPNYDELQVAYDKYLSPLYLSLITSHGFDANAMYCCQFDWFGFVENASRDENGDFWKKYPTGVIPKDDFMEIVNRYFDIEEKDVIIDGDKTITKYVEENGKIEILGGRGGAYPDVYITGIETEGDISHISYVLRAAETGDFYGKGVVTLKNMPDGSFRYITLKMKNE